MSSLIETTQCVIDLCEFTTDLYDSVKSIFEDEEVDINSIKVDAKWVSNRYLIICADGATRDEIELLSSEIEDSDLVILDGAVELKNCACMEITGTDNNWYLKFGAGVV